MQFRTSGSTGRPKFFTLGDEQLAARAVSRAVSKGAAFATIKSLFCNLPLNQTVGLSYLLWAEANGVAFFAPPKGGRIADSLALCASKNIEGIVSGPSALMNFAAAGDSHRFKCVLVTGAVTTPEQSTAIRGGLGDDLYASYGASEVGSIALATATQIEAVAGCVGELCPGVEVEFAEDGQVKVKTTTMIDHYDHNPTATAEAFRDGWFYPGDLGHFENGLLVLTGRV